MIPLTKYSVLIMQSKMGKICGPEATASPDFQPLTQLVHEVFKNFLHINNIISYLLSILYNKILIISYHKVRRERRKVVKKRKTVRQPM